MIKSIFNPIAIAVTRIFTKRDTEALQGRHWNEVIIILTSMCNYQWSKFEYYREQTELTMEPDDGIIMLEPEGSRPSKAQEATLVTTEMDDHVEVCKCWWLINI